MPVNAQNVKTYGFTATAATNATSAFGPVDCLGFKYAHINIVAPAASAASTAQQWTTLKLQESDNSSASFTDVSGFIGNTSAASTTDFLLPSHVSTSAAQIIQWNVDLEKRKRYLQVIKQFSTAVGAASQSMTVQLSRAMDAPDNDIERNVAKSVTG